MGIAPTAQRPTIALSWQRAAMSGLDPGAPVDNLTVEEVDRRSRLMVAAQPVLDEATEELEGTGFSLILADRSARLVDIRCGIGALRPHLEKVGALPGSRFVEETTGTNSIATTFELRQGVAVRGEEHFIEAFKKFSCYGHPVVHPVTHRVEGVLDITCLSEHDNPLLAPFIVRAARHIADRLLEGSRERDQRMLAAFQDAQLRDRSRPVVALGDDVLLANGPAIELLDMADHAVLRGLAADAPVGRVSSRKLVLATGREVLASIQRTGGNDGALVAFDPVQAPAARITERVPAAAPALIHGEPGSGRTTALYGLIGPEPVALLDAGELPEIGERAWLSRMDTMLTSSPLVGIEAVHLLPAPVARRLAMSLRRAKARVVLTSDPVGEVRGELAGLLAHCAQRLELTPLRQRRNEIPALAKAMLRRLQAPRELRFTPSALEALASHPWPGNLRELHSVVRQVVRSRQVGDVSVRDLPSGYQGLARSRFFTPLEQAEHDAIVKALRVCGGNKKDAAKRLGISRTTLYKSIRSLAIVDQVSVSRT